MRERGPREGRRERMHATTAGVECTAASHVKRGAAAEVPAATAAEVAATASAEVAATASASKMAAATATAGPAGERALRTGENDDRSGRNRHNANTDPRHDTLRGAPHASASRSRLGRFFVSVLRRLWIHANLRTPLGIAPDQCVQRAQKKTGRLLRAGRCPAPQRGKSIGSLRAEEARAAVADHVAPAVD